MSGGPGWRDPFEDEERARERERRRAERAGRRRGKREGTRQSLAERVRNQLSGGNDPAPEATPSTPASEPVAPEPTPDPGAPVPWEVPDPRAGYPKGEPETADHPQASPDGFWEADSTEHPIEERPATSDSAAAVPPPVDPHLEAPGPRGWRRAGAGIPPRKRSTIVRRRVAGLLALLVLLALVGAAGYAISKRGDDAPPPAAPVKPRKTESVTIPEGYTRAQMAAVAKKAKLKGSYMKASESSKKIDLAKFGAKNAKNLEGFLFPATYDLYKNASAQDLVDKQVEAFRQNFDGIDMSYAKSKNLSPYDVTIIASMIEREIQKPSERKLAASVIYNRLKRGTPLGIDATIRYEDNNFTKPLLESRLEQDTPYNTRTNTGLPPGPIGNPGLASLQAAANPAMTGYFFYVVKPGACGEHVFVKTQAEFDRATAAYNNARNAAGGNSPTTC